MSRQIAKVFRNLKRLPRAYSGTRTGHTPRDGQPPHHRLAALALCLLLVGSLLGPVAFAGSASAVPSGMVGVPDSNVSEDFPVGEAENASLRASEIEGSVMAAEHAETLEVIVTTPDRARGYLDTNDTATLSGDRGIALVLRDDTHSQGRQVALDAGAVRDALGHTPEQVFGTHENGEEWTANVKYEAGMLVFEVPHFSSNSVTFSGKVSISGTYSDGSTVTYDLADVDSATDPNITLTGALATETDTDSVGAGGALSIAGNAEPLGPSGNTGTDPVIRYDGVGESATEDAGGVTSYTWSSPPLNLKKGEFTYYRPEGYSSELTLTFVAKVDGSTVASKTETIYPTDKGFSRSDTVSFSLSEEETISSSLTYEIEESSTSGVTLGGGNADPQRATSGVDSDFTLSVGGDSKSVTDGSLSTSSKRFDLSTGSPSVEVSNVDYGGYSITAEYTERAQTADPSVSVNGEVQASHSGVLSKGETATYTGNSSVLQSGTNTMTVSMGSLSSDAPSPPVILDYSHKASDKQIVNYSATKWSESYNVSKMFASDRSSASLTIPFDGEVTKVKSIETRTNAGTWSTVSSDNYEFDGTELTVQLGSVSSGDEVEVRTTGRKVNVVNGKITVLEPTMMGDRLDTKFKIDSWSSDAYISLGNTPDGTRVNYLYKESWSGADEYATVTADGYHKLYAPGASVGSSARVSTIPVRVNPKSGQVRVSVNDPLRHEPKFEVAPGESADDEVEYTFVDATDGTSYALYSVTRDTAVDQGTANSPVTLTDDDSEETLQFQVDDSGNLTGSSDGGGGFFESSASGAVIPAMPVLNPGLVVAIVLAIIVGAVAYQQRRIQKPDVPDRPVYRSPLVLLAVVVALFLGILLISPETVTTWITLGVVKPLSQALSAALPLAGVLGVMAGIGMIVYWWWTRRQAKKADASTPDTVFRISANKGDEK